MYWPVSQGSPNPHSLSLSPSFLHSPCVSFSHFHSRTLKLRKCWYYHICLYTWVQSSRETYGQFCSSVELGDQSILGGELCTTITSPLCPSHPLSHKLPGANADCQTAFSKIPGEEWNERKTDGYLPSCYWTFSDLKMLWKKKKNNQTPSPSPFSLSISLLYVSLTFSQTPHPPLVPPLCFTCRQMLATVFSERPVLATWTRPWSILKMASI